MFRLAYSCCHPSICIFASLSSSSAKHVKFCAMFSSSTKTPEQRNLVHMAAFIHMEVLSAQDERPTFVTLNNITRKTFFFLFLGSLCTAPLPLPSVNIGEGAPSPIFAERMRGVGGGGVFLYTGYF